MGDVEWDYDVIRTERQDYLISLSEASGENSSRSGVKSWAHEYNKRKICCERSSFGQQNETLPIPIVCEVFSSVAKIFNDDSVLPAAESCRCATNLVREMKDIFKSQEERVSSFHSTTNEYLPWMKSGQNATGYPNQK